MELQNLPRSNQLLLLGGAVVAVMMFFGCCMICGVFAWFLPSRGDLSSGPEDSQPIPFADGGGGSDGTSVTDDPATPARGSTPHGKPLSSDVPTKALGGKKYVTKETLILNAEQARSAGLIVSPDGTRYAHWLPDGDSHKVYVHGKLLATTPPLKSALFSRDGKHFICVPTEGGSYYLDGKEVRLLGVQSEYSEADRQTWEKPIVWTVQVNHDASRVAAVTYRQSAQNYQHEYQLFFGTKSHARTCSGDGASPFSIQEPELTWTMNTAKAWSATGAENASKPKTPVASIGHRDGKQFVIFRGQEQKVHNVISNFVVSANEQRLAYWSEIPGDPNTGSRARYKLYVDDDEAGFIVPDSFSFSPDSAHWSGVEEFDVSYVGNARAKRVVLDGQPFRRYDDCSSPWFTPDSRNIYFLASRRDENLGQRQFVVFNGKELPEYAGVTMKDFNYHPGAYAYTVRKDDGKTYVVTNGRESGPIDEVKFTPGSTTPTGWQWSQNGPLVYQTTMSNLRGFSPDGKSLAFLARRGDYWHAVLDGKPSNPFNQILEGRFGFTPHGSFTYIGVRKGAHYWVEEQPQ